MRKISIIVYFSFLLSPLTKPNNCIAQQTMQKDLTVFIYYDSSLRILDAIDSNNAKYHRIINYKDGNIYGPVTDYYKSGQVMMSGYYSGSTPSQGNENGKFIYYYETGKTFQTCNYVNGVLEGPYIEYYPSGLKKALVPYSKGIRYGCEFAWDKDGNLTRNAFIENNQVNPHIQCDTVFEDQVVSVKKIDNPDAPVTSQERNNNKNVSNQSKNKDCEKKNTGDYCFTNSTGKDLFFTLYIPKENTGTYVQIDRFNNVSVSWSSEVWVNAGKTSCFYDLPSGEVNYRVRDNGRSFSESTINTGGAVTVEVCKVKTHVIK